MEHIVCRRKNNMQAYSPIANSRGPRFQRYILIFGLGKQTTQHSSPSWNPTATVGKTDQETSEQIFYPFLLSISFVHGFSIFVRMLQVFYAPIERPRYTDTSCVSASPEAWQHGVHNAMQCKADSWTSMDFHGLPWTPMDSQILPCQLPRSLLAAGFNVFQQDEFI